MNNRFGILLVKKLSKLNMIFLSGLSGIGFDVRYMFYPDHLKKSGDSAESIANRLARRGLVKIDFSEIADLDQYGKLKHCPQLSHEVYNEHFSGVDLGQISPLFAELDDLNHKLPVLYFDIIFRSIFEIGDLLSIAHAYRSQGLKVSIFHPFGFILSKIWKKPESGFRNIFPGFLSIGNEIISIGFALIKRIFINSGSHIVSFFKPTISNLEGATDSSNNIDQSFDVVFFPHKGVAYGNAFVKNHFYDDAPDSPLNASRIFHVELHRAITDESKAFYQTNNIPHISLLGGMAINRNTLKHLMRGSVRIWQSIKEVKSLESRAVVFIVMLRGYISFLNAFNTSSRLQGTKVALIGYDYLFPPAMSMALQSRGIKLVAVQERFVNVFNPDFHPILDTYFISGDGINHQLQKNSNHWVKEKKIVGLVRAEQLKKLRKQVKPSKSCSILVLDFHSDPDEFTDVFDPLVSWKSNFDFYMDILRLAEIHPDVEFVIRGKDDAWCSIPYFEEVISRIDKLDNVSINHEYDEMGVSYRLAALADLIIARQTSLGDEALAARIPVLFHDWRRQQAKNVSDICDYQGFDIYVHDFETLKMRVDGFVRDGFYMPEGVFDQMRSDLFGEPIDETKLKILTHVNAMLVN